MSVKLTTATTPSGISLLFRFIQIVLIPKLAAPLISLFKESPICTISCGFKLVSFKAISNNSARGLYDFASSLVNTLIGVKP